MTHKLTRSNIGPALIVLGGALLATRVLEFGVLEFPFLSAVLVVIGTLQRESAWFIPGGILAGIGLGDYLSEASFLASSLTEKAATGVFLLSFALGWVGVFALSKRLGDAPNAWALVPAIVMSVLGTLLLSAGAGERVLEVASYAWPLGLVAVGAYLVLKTQTNHD